MTDLPDFIEAGEDFIAHFGKKGMKWGHRTGSSTRLKSIRSKASSAGKSVRTAASVTGRAVGKGASVTVTKLRSPEVKNAVKTTGQVAIRLGAAHTFGLIGIIGLTAVTAIIHENPDAIQSGKDFVATKLDDIGLSKMSFGEKADIKSREFLKDDIHKYQRMLPDIEKNNAR